jgi:hypothetical protein
MVTGAPADHAAHIEQMQTITCLQLLRNVAHKSFECPAFPKNAREYVASADLREPAGRQLDVSVCD